MVTVCILAWQALYQVTMAEDEVVCGEGPGHPFAHNIQQLMRKTDVESPCHHLRLSNKHGGAPEASIKPCASFTTFFLRFRLS